MGHLLSIMSFGAGALQTLGSFRGLTPSWLNATSTTASLFWRIVVGLWLRSRLPFSVRRWARTQSEKTDEQAPSEAARRDGETLILTPKRKAVAQKRILEVAAQLIQVVSRSDRHRSPEPVPAHEVMACEFVEYPTLTRCGSWRSVTIVRITGGNFRLVDHLVSQIERIQASNKFMDLTSESSTTLASPCSSAVKPREGTATYRCDSQHMGVSKS